MVSLPYVDHNATIVLGVPDILPLARILGNLVGIVHLIEVKSEQKNKLVFPR